MIFIGYALSGADSVLFPQVEFGGLEWGLLAALPPVTAIIAMITARRTVLRGLAKLS